MDLKHIAFIPDGNGRWAQAHGMERKEGYVQGLKALKAVIARAEQRGIEALSVFAFSTENVARPHEEQAAIFRAVESFNNSYDGDMRILYMGDIDSLDERLAQSVEDVERRTAANTGMILNIALAYGGRADIVRAAKLAADSGDFTEEGFLDRLSTRGLPPLDLVVRTGGRKRLSNFMLYEAAYAELIFLDKLWGDMSGEDVDMIIDEFESRKRTFGA